MMNNITLQEHSFYSYSKCCINWFIRSDETLSDIAKLLKIIPETYYNIGDGYLGKEKRSEDIIEVKKIRTHSLLQISTKTNVVGNNINDHFEWIRNELEIIKENVILFNEKIEKGFFVYLLASEYPNGIVLTKNNLLGVQMFYDFIEIRTFDAENDIIWKY